MMVAVDVGLELKRHPLSELCGEMESDVGKMFSDGVADWVDEAGLEIVTLDGRVLDGWLRLQAFRRYGIEPRFVEFEGDDPVGFLLRRNVFRRHLDDGQRVLIIKDAYEWLDRQAKGEPVSHGELAGTAKTSKKTVQRAMKAEDAGIGDWVRRKEMSATTAADVAAHDDLVTALKSGEMSTEDVVEEVKARKPPTRLEKSEQRRMATEYELLQSKERIDELELELKAIRGSLSEGSDSAEVERVVSMLNRSVRTLVSQNRLMADYYRDMVRARDYWRDRARREGYEPTGREKSELARMEAIETRAAEEIGAALDYADAATAEAGAGFSEDSETTVVTEQADVSSPSSHVGDAGPEPVADVPRRPTLRELALPPQVVLTPEERAKYDAEVAAGLDPFSLEVPKDLDFTPVPSARPRKWEVGGAIEAEDDVGLLEADLSDTDVVDNLMEMSMDPDAMVEGIGPEGESDWYEDERGDPFDERNLDGRSWPLDDEDYAEGSGDDDGSESDYGQIEMGGDFRRADRPRDSSGHERPSGYRRLGMEHQPGETRGWERAGD